MEHEGRCVGNRVNAYTSDMDFHGGSKLSKLTYPMHNFIDKVEWKETEKKDYVLYFGRFSEEKGIGTLIKVCKELPDVQFIFAGSKYCCCIEKSLDGSTLSISIL